MSHRQIPLRAAAILAATAGALVPVADLLAQRRKRRPANNDDDDDDIGDLARRRLRRRRNAEDDDENDNDELVIALARARRRKAQRQEANDDEVEDAAANPANRQSIVADLGIRETVQERIDNVLSGGGGGGGEDEPNITVSQDGDSLIALTRDIEFASDSEGIEVETGGISFTSGAGGGVLDDFDS